MKRGLVILLLMGSASSTLAGPFPGAAGQPGSTALHMNTNLFVSWASGWTNYTVGGSVSNQFQNPSNAVGPSTGGTFDVVTLGNGGSITLSFDVPIADGPGFDFAVFENAFNDTFLELAYVEVSTDGSNFFRFANQSLTAVPVPFLFGIVDPTDIDGYGGKYQAEYGTPFDLQEMNGVSPLLDLDNVNWVRIVDIVGDSNYTDSVGNVIYDPHPTPSDLPDSTSRPSASSTSPWFWTSISPPAKRRSPGPP